MNEFKNYSKEDLSNFYNQTLIYNQNLRDRVKILQAVDKGRPSYEQRLLKGNLYENINKSYQAKFMLATKYGVVL